MIIRKTLFFLVMAALCLSSALFISGKGVAQENPGQPTLMQNVGYEDFKLTLEKTISLEKNKINQLNQQLQRLEETRKSIASEINSYNIQISAHANLLLVPDPAIKDLEEAKLTNQSSITNVTERVKNLTQRSESVSLLQMQANEQYLLFEKQLRELQDQELESEIKTEVIKVLKQILGLLERKNELLKQLQELYQELITMLKDVRSNLSSLVERFDAQIQTQKKEELFKRKSRQMVALHPAKVFDEVKQLTSKIGTLFSRQFWETELSIVWRSSGLYVVSSMLLFAITQLLFYRLNRYFDYLLREPSMENYPWRRLMFRVFRRSLVLLATVLFFYIYAQIFEITSGITLFRLVLNLLIIWLFTKWAIDATKFCNETGKVEIPTNIHIHLRLLFVMIRYFSVAYIIVDWFLLSTSVMLIFSRFAFEIALLIWTALFWKCCKKESAELFSKQFKGVKVFRSGVSAILYTVAGGGFVADLAGFGNLAIYWYVSWGKTAVAIFWGCLLLLAIREREWQVRETTKSSEDQSVKSAYPLRWLFLRVAWVLWAFALVIALMVAWGAKQPLIFSIFKILNYPFEIGQLNFSLLNFIYACLVLVLTNIFANFWRHILREKLLDQSALEPGLKDSVTSISLYLVWGLGILIALHAFGLSATSLAVAFGALGIGLGFGLQNIFNNFISGIILLFERPIQVGDAIEINGIWGEVRKINVRSTLVQTYDNATLIIPNSQFISSQVTNWSFKDLRLRRTIVVGVAYNSDIDLVRETLQEIAQKTPRVLKFPKPEVLFHDFGNSALIFRLRVWTDVDYMLIVESDIRFQIKRLFKERNIEIAYPQQDLHIRSVDRKNAVFEFGQNGKSKNENRDDVDSSK